MDLVVGEKCRLTFDGFTNTKIVTWYSHDTSIAAVTSKGKVKAAAKGLVMITAADDKGNQKHIYEEFGNVKKAQHILGFF